MSEESLGDDDFVQDDNGSEKADSFDETWEKAVARHQEEKSNKQSDSRPQTAQRPRSGQGRPWSSSSSRASAPFSRPATATAMPSDRSAHGDRENRESNTNNTPSGNANNGASSNTGGPPGELGLHPQRRSSKESASSLGTSQAAQMAREIVLEASQYVGAPDSQSEGGGGSSTSNHAATVAVDILQAATAAMYSRNSLSDSVGGVGVVGGVGDGEAETVLSGYTGVSRARSSVASNVIPAMAHGKGKGLYEDPHVMQPSPDGGMNGSFNEGSRGEEKADRTSPPASQKEEGDISRASGGERSAEESRPGQSSVGADGGLDGDGEGGAVSQSRDDLGAGELSELSPSPSESARGRSRTMKSDSVSLSRGGRDEMTQEVSISSTTRPGEEAHGGQNIYTEGVHGGIRTGVEPVDGDGMGVWGRSADSMDAPPAILRPQDGRPGRRPRTCSATRSDRPLTYAEATAAGLDGTGLFPLGGASGGIASRDSLGLGGGMIGGQMEGDMMMGFGDTGTKIPERPKTANRSAAYIKAAKDREQKRTAMLDAIVERVFETHEYPRLKGRFNTLQGRPVSQQSNAKEKSAVLAMAQMKKRRQYELQQALLSTVQLTNRLREQLRILDEHATAFSPFIIE
uniref:Uncharacterized protein n=1 Tax=Chromera velia CCMP2878 TaxID=1169474 RepID=A0A0G4H2E3_9ALVE|eukprot:Cvel_24367.t1-p1 / transcript=Cvel_24367.t1 / gene=Cvel_24367 / organism=Chromera_velia_CCMP2878 / gene_product=hypothetical protein / transcript_product=hypothetical protein / location=Cvel_scaffold2623:20133-25113(+) / protein_length=629 / sequence_SO=supercontig / SO=protein_coding / is_pseudo=false